MKKFVNLLICLCISVAAPRSHKLKHLRKLHNDKAMPASRNNHQNETDSPKKQYVPAIMIVQNLPGSNAAPAASSFPSQPNWIPGFPVAAGPAIGLPPQQNALPGFASPVATGMNFATGTHHVEYQHTYQTEPALQQAQFVEPARVIPAHAVQEVEPYPPVIPRLKPIHRVHPVTVQNIGHVHKIGGTAQHLSSVVKPSLVVTEEVKPVLPLIDPSEQGLAQPVTSAVVESPVRPSVGIVPVDQKPVPAVVTKPVGIAVPATGFQNQTLTIGLDFKSDGDIRLVNENSDAISLPLKNPLPPVDKNGNFELVISDANAKGNGEIVAVTKPDDDAVINQGIVREVANILNTGAKSSYEPDNASEIDPDTGATIIHTSQLDRPLGVAINSAVQETSTTRQIKSNSHKKEQPAVERTKKKTL